MGRSIGVRIFVALSPSDIVSLEDLGVIPLGFGYVQHLYDIDMSIDFRIWIGVSP